MRHRLLFILFFISFTSQTFSQTTTSNLLTQINLLDAALQNGLKSANSILSEQQRTLFINMTNYTSYLKDNLKDLTDDLNRNLTQRENEILNEVSSYLTKVEEIVSGVRTDIQDVTLSLENSITRLPFTKRNPTTSYIDVPVLTTVQQKSIDINIRGVRLDNQRNYIVFNGKKYTNPIIPSPKQNQYRITLNENDIFNPDTLNLLEIYVFKRKKPSKFTALFSVVPNKIGTMTVTYKTFSKNTVYSDYYTETVTSSPGGTSWRHVDRQVNKRGGEGWKIEKGSISVRKTQGAEGGSSCNSSPNNVTDISFIAEADGKCQRVFPGGVECGTTRCEFKWREYKLVDNIEQATQSVDVNFNEQKVLQFPENTTGLVKTDIKFFDGSIFTTIDPSFTKNFIKFRFDLARKVAEASFKP